VARDDEDRSTEVMDSYATIRRINALAEPNDYALERLETFRGKEEFHVDSTSTDLLYRLFNRHGSFSSYACLGTNFLESEGVRVEHVGWVGPAKRGDDNLVNLDFLVGVG